MRVWKYLQYTTKQKSDQIHQQGHTVKKSLFDPAKQIKRLHFKSVVFLYENKSKLKKVKKSKKKYWQDILQDLIYKCLERKEQNKMNIDIADKILLDRYLKRKKELFPNEIQYCEKLIKKIVQEIIKNDLIKKI